MPATINSTVDTIRALLLAKPAERPAPAPLPAVRRIPLPCGAHAGLARVLEVAPDGRPRVRLAAGGEALAQWALPYAYEPRPGDQLWVVGKDEQVYVLGVLWGRGTSRVAARGLEVAAGGRLRLIADTKLRLISAQVVVRAGEMRVAARTLHTLTRAASVRVKGLARLTAGRVQRVTAGLESVRARRVVQLAKGLVKIDANRVIGLG